MSTEHNLMQSISIIIPAHNEAAVIRRTLTSLLDGLGDIPVQVVVVCNGCVDGTADCARAVSDPRILVIEIPNGSKTGAMNEGDRYTSIFPRVYMDADVQLRPEDLNTLCAYMVRTGVPAAVPMARMNFDGVSGPVQAYYKIWFSLTYIRSGMVGCGVYALSKEGRARFGKFPGIISDDGFVRAHFSDKERPVVGGCIVTVRAPRTLAGLIKIKTRSRLGGRQLRECYPKLFNKELSNSRWRTLLWYLFRPNLWLAMPYYLLVVGISLWRSWRQFKRQDFSVWERDETSRHPHSEVAGA